MLWPARHSLIGGLCTLWRLPFFRLIMFSTGFCNFCAHAIINWGPSLVMPNSSPGSIYAGPSLGFGIAVCGGVAMVVSGRIVSAFVSDGLQRPLQIAALLQFLTMLLRLDALFIPDGLGCIALLCLSYGFQSFFIPIY